MSTLSWRDDATHIIIVFTDERGQSYNHDPALGTCGSERGGPNNEFTMCDSINGELVAILTNETFRGGFNCDGFGPPSPTIIYLLVNDAVEMATNLRAILESACAE